MSIRKLVLPRVADETTQKALDLVTGEYAKMSAVDLLQGNLLTGVSIATTQTPIPHKLGRKAKGYLIVGSDYQASGGGSGASFAVGFGVNGPAAGGTAAMQQPLTVTTGFSLAFIYEWIAPVAGTLTAISLGLRGAAGRTAGEVGVWVKKSTDGGDTYSDLWGSSGSPVASLDATNDETATATANGETFNAGDKLAVHFISDGSWAPTNDVLHGLLYCNSLSSGFSIYKTSDHDANHIYLAATEAVVADIWVF